MGGEPGKEPHVVESGGRDRGQLFPAVVGHVMEFELCRSDMGGSLMT